MTLTSAWSILRTLDDYYRYVNHEQRLLTTGFATESALVRNTDIIRIDRIDPRTIVVMRIRYEVYIEK